MIGTGTTVDAFMINRQTGEIILVQPLDFETTPSYSITVQVSDPVNSVRHYPESTHLIIFSPLIEY